MTLTLKRTLEQTSLALAVLLLASACSGQVQSDGKLRVVAGLYPLAYVAERIGGELVDVTNLTPPAGHAHELELSARQVADITEANLVIHISGLQPALDEAIGVGPEGQAVLDALTVVPAPLDDTPNAAGSDSGADSHGHAHENSQADGDVHGTSTDPHMWLDPQLFAQLGDAVAAELTKLQPESRQVFEQNAAELSGELWRLDSDFHVGTSNCSNRTLIVGHLAYGRLAASYSFEQVGVAGVSPESEPSPARLAKIAELVRSLGVTTVYSESALDRKVADTIAAETGANVLVLSPLESLSDPSSDYFSVMRDNLAAIRQGQGCK